MLVIKSKTLILKNSNSMLQKAYLPLKKINLPQLYPQAIESLIKLDTKREYILEFSNQTIIPNIIKLNNLDRRLIILKFTHSAFLWLQEITTIQSTEQVIIQLIHGQIIIQGDCKTKFRNINHILVDYGAYVISSDIVNLRWKSILSETKSTIVCIEIINNSPKKYEDILYRPLQPIKNVDYILSIDHVNNRKSAVVRKLTEAEIWEKAVILDVEMGMTNDNQFVPLHVVMIDLNGTELMNTLVSPRLHVKNYFTDIHGITEEDVLGKMDEYDCLAMVRSLLYEKILIGSDLQNDVKCLRIKPCQLYGIRDLSSNACIKTFLDSKKCLNSLKVMAKEILNRDIQVRVHSALEDVEAVKDIYKRVFYLWKDDQGPMANEVVKKEQSSNEKIHGDNTRIVRTLKRRPLKKSTIHSQKECKKF